MILMRALTNLNRLVGEESEKTAGVWKPDALDEDFILLLDQWGHRDATADLSNRRKTQDAAILQRGEERERENHSVRRPMAQFPGGWGGGGGGI